eukprot:g2682.t1
MQAVAAGRAAAAPLVALWQGYLQKTGENNKSWKRRYFVVTGKQISYYTNETCSKLKGSINVGTIEGVAGVDKNKLCLVTPQRLWLLRSVSQSNHREKDANKGLRERVTIALSRTNADSDEEGGVEQGDLGNSSGIGDEDVRSSVSSNEISSANDMGEISSEEMKHVLDLYHVLETMLPRVAVVSQAWLAAPKCFAVIVSSGDLLRFTDSTKNTFLGHDKVTSMWETKPLQVYVEDDAAGVSTLLHLQRGTSADVRAEWKLGHRRGGSPQVVASKMQGNWQSFDNLWGKFGEILLCPAMRHGIRFGRAIDSGRRAGFWACALGLDCAGVIKGDVQPKADEEADKVLLAYTRRNTNVLRLDGWAPSLRAIVRHALLFTNQHGAYQLLSAIIENVAPAYYSSNLSRDIESHLFAKLIAERLPDLSETLLSRNISMCKLLRPYLDTLFTHTHVDIASRVWDEAFMTTWRSAMMRTLLALFIASEDEIGRAQSAEDAMIILEKKSCVSIENGNGNEEAFVPLLLQLGILGGDHRAALPTDRWVKRNAVALWSCALEELRSIRRHADQMLAAVRATMATATGLMSELTKMWTTVRDLQASAFSKDRNPEGSVRNSATSVGSSLQALVDSVHTAARPVVSAASILDEKLSTASALARKLEQEAQFRSSRSVLPVRMRPRRINPIGDSEKERKICNGLLMGITESAGNSFEDLRMEIQSLISVVISLGWRLCSASWACSAWIARHQWRNSQWTKTDIITEVHSLDLTARVCHEALQLFGSAVDKLCPALINIVECDAESKTREA